MGAIAHHLIIVGHVQGVFYRNWAMQTAVRLDLTGWVRNRLDGSVEAWIEGPVEELAQFVALAHKGPPAAKVARVDVKDEAVQGYTAFEKRPTS